MAIFDDDKIIKNFQMLLTSAQESGWQWWKKNEYIEGKRFFDGIEHYDSDVLVQLKRRDLRPIVMNRTWPFIKRVSNAIGKAVGAARYYPLDDIDNQDTAQEKREDSPNDEYSSSMNELSKWGKEQGHFERAASKVREDASICGIGVMESRLNMEGDNVFGEPEYTRIPPIEVVIDQDAQQTNFPDARDMFRARIMDRAAFTDQFSDSPKVKEIGDGVDQIFTMLQSSDTDNTSINPLFEVTAFDSRLRDNNVTVYDYQWFQKEDIFVVKNPLTDERTARRIFESGVVDIALTKFVEENGLKIDSPSWSLFTEEFNDLKKILNDFKLESAKKKKKRYYRAFIAGNIVLKKTESPFPNGFTYTFYTQYYDEDKRVPYGYMRMIKDPQRTANASFLHMFHSVLSAPKPSVFAEEGVSDNHSDFEQKMAQRDSVIWIKDGKMASVRENIPSTVPTGYENPLQIAITSQFQTTGLNFDMMGQQEKEVSGVLDKQRTERGDDSLKDVIDNYRMFLKEVAQKDLQLYKDIAEQSPGEIIRVIGSNGIQAIPLLKDDSNKNFAVVIDDAPVSINQKSENVKVLFDVLSLPNIPQGMMPDIISGILENADMPKELRDKLDKALTDSTSSTPEIQAAQLEAQSKQQEAEAELIRANTVEKEGEAIKDAADAEKKQAEILKINAETAKIVSEMDNQELENAKSFLQPINKPQS